MKNYSERLFAHLSRKNYVPVPAETIAKEWKLDKKRRSAFYAEIAKLVRSGQIALIKNDRVCLPKEADLVTGTINFRQKGSAMVSPEARATEPRKPAIYIHAA